MRFLTQIRGDSQISYNFFSGPDAADFSTTIDGFGSGILDFFGGRSSLDLINYGTGKFYLSAGAGLSIIKYRLADNLLFVKSEDNLVTVIKDSDPTHEYVNTFFGYGKSKLITTSVYFPIDINVSMGKNLTVSAGGYIDLNITARYKIKYLVGEDKVKEIIRSKDFRNLNPSTTKVGVQAAILLKKPSIGISGAYSFTPFFKAGMGPEINEARISATYAIRSLHKPKKVSEVQVKASEKPF